jgi:GTP-binding protein HflX
MSQIQNDDQNGTTPRDVAPTRDASGYISNEVQPERVIISHLMLDGHHASSTRTATVEADESEESSLGELTGLCEAANAIVVGAITQKRDKPHPATLFGKGKVEEIDQLCREQEADVLVVDHELSPAQGRNLEKMLKVRVVDRTELILDIFARRAQTRQAKLQVELAQLRYQLPRLKRMWTHLERTGGGIGTRGPGETQLETDRRLAGERIAYLQKQLDEIRKQKETESVGRADFETGALVGYTNVGKSALLNALSRPTGKGVLVANQLFATLGASTRRVELGQGRDVLLSDTVGFVRRLPHNLVECFHSTLAEVEAANFLLLVANAADPELDEKMAAVRRVLNEEMHIPHTPQILVLNQCDRLNAEQRAELQLHHRDAVFTSALSGEGLDELKLRILQELEAGDEEVQLTLDAGDECTGKLLSEIARHGRILEESWSANDGAQPQVHVRASLAPRWIDKLELRRREAAAA